jgi:hypothetical protein
VLNVSSHRTASLSAGGTAALSASGSGAGSGARHHSRRVTLGSRDFDPDVGFETARLLSGSTGGGNDSSSRAAAADTTVSGASSGSSSRQYGESSSSSSSTGKAGDSATDVSSDVAVDSSEEWVQVQRGAGLSSSADVSAGVNTDAAASSDTAAATATTANNSSSSSISNSATAGHPEPPAGPAPPVPEELLPPTLDGESLATSLSTSALASQQLRALAAAAPLLDAATLCRAHCVCKGWRGLLASAPKLFRKCLRAPGGIPTHRRAALYLHISKS